MSETQISGRLLGIGLDDILKKRIRLTSRRYRLKLRCFFHDEISEINQSQNQVDTILLQVDSHFGGALKKVQEMLYQFPRSALIIISPKSDPHLLIHFFRAGVFDILFTPFDNFELVQALRRVSLRSSDMVTPGEWTPLQAASHFFTRPITDQWDDLADNLHRYFSLFLKIKEHKKILLAENADSFFIKKHNLTKSQAESLKNFLQNPNAIFLGLQLFNDKLAWAIKLADNFICYWEARNDGKAATEDVFSTGFRNLLRGQREHYESHLERQRMKVLALTDEITGLWNQRKLTQDLEEKVHLRSKFALLFIDIDFFKSVNDQFGHVHGSQLLIDMAEILKHELRDSDLIYRYGGDEFIVLLPFADLESAKVTALRLSTAIKRHEFVVQEKPYKLSLSVGIAVYPLDAMSARALIDFADQMMYMSKKSGRGKVFHVTEVMGG
jgi:diguanylate cyclase (GGDEF)-like protein